MFLFGWTPQDFAVAAARYARCEGVMPKSTSDGAYGLRGWWLSRYQYSPNEIAIDGVNKDVDYEYAGRLFSTLTGIASK